MTNSAGVFAWCSMRNQSQKTNSALVLVLISILIVPVLALIILG